MRLLILLMALAAPGWGAWSVCKAVTVNPAQVTGGPHLNFKMVISGTYSWLASTGNGGVMTDAQGDDLRVYSTSDCTTTAINYEKVEWTAAGFIHLVVRVSSLDNGSVVYIGAGDSGVTTDGSNKTAVYAEELGVYHLPDGSTLGLSDSSATARDLTASLATATSGKIGGAASFAGGSNGDILYNSTSITSYSTMSTCVWLLFNAVDATARRAYNTVDDIWVWTTNGLMFQALWTTGGQWYVTTPSTGNWHHVCVTYDSTSTSNDPVMYVNGSAQSVTESVAPSGSFPATSSRLNIGNRTDTIRAWDGKLDEFMRIHGTIWTAGYIATMYANQNAPDTFYTITDVVGSATRRRYIDIQ